MTDDDDNYDDDGDDYDGDNDDNHNSDDNVDILRYLVVGFY